ncbi:MAG TPA: hypothetical protein ENJ09_15665 [Planctomycetes bacterium]|nr:hypothetical protein [Planctomycetota bacterium]
MFDSHSGPHAPIPGTTPTPRALFIDRWGTLLDTPERGYAVHPDEVRFLPGALDALFRAVRTGWKVYLVGNEDAVAYGDLHPDAWRAVEEHMLAQLTAAGVLLTRHYACTTRPDGVEGQVADSVYLLPNTGAFYHAAHEDGIELRHSWVIGDSTLELVAGWRSGCRIAAVQTGLALSDAAFGVEPEFTARDLAEAIGVLLRSSSIAA